MSKRFQFPIDKVLNPEPSNDPVRISSYFDWSKFSGFLDDCKSRQVKEKPQSRKRKREIPKSLSAGCSPIPFSKPNCLNNIVEENRQSFKRRATSFSDPSVSCLSKFSYVTNNVNLSLFPEKKEFDQSYTNLEKNSSSFNVPEQIIGTCNIDSSAELSRLSASSENLSPLTVYDCVEGSGINSNKSPENEFQFSIETHKAGDITEKCVENEISYTPDPIPTILFSDQITEDYGRDGFSEESQDNAFTTLLESSPPNLERPPIEMKLSGPSTTDNLNSKPSCFQPDFNSNGETHLLESEFLGQPIELIEALLKISSYTPENSLDIQNSSGSSQSFAPSLVQSDISALNILSLAAMAVEQKQQLQLDDNNYIVPDHSKQINYLSSTESTVTISRAEYRRLIALQALVSQVDELKLLEFLLNGS